MKLPLPKTKIRPFWKSVHLTHRFYQITGGYRFFMDGMRKLGWAMLVMGVVL